MTLKKTVSMLLTLVLLLSILAPCGTVLHAHAATTLYENDLEQVTEPAIGSSYYLAANVDGAINYVVLQGSVTDTTPYSLSTTTDFSHANLRQVTLEAPVSGDTGFQITVLRPSDDKLLRIYCFDASGSDGIMDTGTNTGNELDRHTFYIDVVNGVTVLRKTGNENILAVKYFESVGAWRMLGVPESELANEGVYPVMLLQEHVHSFGDVTVDTENNTHSRTCASCGYTDVVYDCTVSSVDEAVVGESYYLTVNVSGTPYYFRHGTISDTVPYSLVATTNFNHNWTFPVTLEAPAEGDMGFQMTYTHPTNSKTVRIYCYDSSGDGQLDTGVTSNAATLDNNTFYVDEVDGVKVLRKSVSDYILALKNIEQTVKAEDGTVSTVNAWRMLGVDESELANEGVYPVMLTQMHEHIADGKSYGLGDSGHSPLCWCGEVAGDEVAHTYGSVTADADNDTCSRTCTVCGYENVIYSQRHEQVKYPAIGGSYYLAANVNGTLQYFVLEGKVTDTTPYSLHATDDFSNVNIKQVTLEEAVTAGKGEFQLTFYNGTTLTRIYCYDALKDAAVAGQTGIMDTGTNAKSTAANHTFSIDEIGGVTVLRKYGNDNILVVKYNETTGTYRMLGVPEAELANEGVYPAVLMNAHEHTYGDWSFDAENGTQSHTCTVCGYVHTLHGTDNKVTKIDNPVVGGSYYLAANVAGTINYFVQGTVTTTTPYSLVVTTDFSNANLRQVTLETPVSGDVGFQITYLRPSDDATLRIYCYDAKASDGVMDTGVNSKSTLNNHTFFVDEVNGVTVLRKYGNENVLVVKYNETTGTWRMLGVPEAELANEGVYPAMLAEVHTHEFEEEYCSDETGHWRLCDCGSSSDVISHSMGDWTLDAEAMTQSAACSVCGYAQTENSPYFDTVDSEEELISGLAEIAQDENSAYYAQGGKDYYLTTEIDGKSYYFRQTGRTAAGNGESVTTTSGYSLYTTDNINHRGIYKLNVTAGSAENSYILTYTSDACRALYINDEGADSIIDAGVTAYRGNTGNATYVARTDFMWDAANGCLYQDEDGVKYVLAVKQLEANYKATDADSGETVVVETATEWRIAAVPVSEATAENGCYILKLAQHVHNYPTAYTTDNEGHWKVCGCGYKDYAEHTVESWTVTAPPTETATGSKTGVCTVCGTTVTVETPITVSEWNIVLSDDIGVNFVLALTEGDVVKVTVGGSEVPAVLTDNGNGTYTVFIELAAAQMTDAIAISVNGYALEKTYSVRAYADVILAEDYTEHTKNLVKYMLVYGSAAQNYFAHNTGVLAGDGIEVTASVPAEAPELELLNELTGVKFYGASLLHQTKTAVRFYFTADSVEGLTFYVNGDVYEPVSKSGKYCIELAGIDPQDLGDTLNVVVTDGTNSLAVAYSPLIYIARMYNKADSSEAIKELVQTMYGYHLAAKTYLANLNLDDDFTVSEQTVGQLYDGVALHEMVYIAAGYGEVEAYALVVDADAQVELKVSAGAWDENTNADNPAETATVSQHFRNLQDAGYNVLAMTNGGFFDLTTTKTNLPNGMQIVDGVVKQAPSTNNAYSNHWFGMTTDGQYVISDAAGYESTYAGKIQQGVGGGKLLMIDGIPQNIASERAYRTAVGVNDNGDLVIVAVADATYSDVNHVFVDLGMDIVTVLNLDGGGSTAMYVPGTYYPTAKILGNDGLFPREVADAIAIVVKE